MPDFGQRDFLGPDILQMTSSWIHLEHTNKAQSFIWNVQGPRFLVSWQTKDIVKRHLKPKSTLPPLCFNLPDSSSSISVETYIDYKSFMKLLPYWNMEHGWPKSVFPGCGHSFVSRINYLLPPLKWELLLYQHSVPSSPKQRILMPIART